MDSDILFSNNDFQFLCSAMKIYSIWRDRNVMAKIIVTLKETHFLKLENISEKMILNIGLNDHS